MNKRDAYDHMDLGSALTMTGFGRGARVEASPDPIVRSRIVLTLDQLQTYEHNPRHSANPLYAELKSSIHARGLDHPPPVSRRPGELHYVIVNGGNSRLQALRELFTETQDRRFFEIECDFVPWISESHALSGHLIENDVRGEMIFLDRALALQQLRDFYQRERNVDAIGVRELSRLLGEAGYAIAHSHLSKMFQMLELLYPAIPEALRAGLGKHQVERLLRLRAVCIEMGQDRRQREDSVALLFEDALRAVDTPEWSYDSAQEIVLTRFAEYWELPYRALLLDVEARLCDRHPRAVAAIAPEPLSTNSPSQINEAALSDQPLVVDRQAVTLPPASTQTTVPTVTNDHSAIDPSDPMAVDQHALDFLVRSNALLSDDIEALRALITSKVAQFAGMLPNNQAWVHSTPGEGVGFAMVWPAGINFYTLEHGRAQAEVFWFLYSLTVAGDDIDLAAREALCAAMPLASATQIFTAVEWDEHTSASALAITVIARRIRHRLGWK